MILTTKAKYAKDGAREICPAPISPPLRRVCGVNLPQRTRPFGLRGYSRADFILGADDSLAILEVNTLPGMTATACRVRHAPWAWILDSCLKSSLSLGWPIITVTDICTGRCFASVKRGPCNTVAGMTSSGSLARPLAAFLFLRRLS